MPSATRLFRGTYRDSVSLMQLSARVAALAGVEQASVVMATPGNLELLRESGLLVDAAEASPSDLLAVVRGESAAAAEAALAEVEQMLSAARPDAQAAPAAGEPAPRSLQMGRDAMPEANLALISAPGDYAAAEALKALRLGLHAMLFSDNVSLEDEAMLKREAAGRGLLVMGPDCGTAIVGGIPLGFANAVRRGAVGVVGASGTGMQQVTVLVHRAGAGISHALGTGSHDLSAAIGGATMLAALEELAGDEATKVIVLVSKPPAREVAQRVLERARRIPKPVVACFLGAPASEVEGGNVVAAATLEEAAARAAAAARGERASPASSALPRLARPKLAPGRRFLRGLYSGGTFCYEATLLLSPALGEVSSNTPVGAARALEDPWRSTGHTLVDLGDDAFTRGRPHPMIDMRLRCERLVREAADPETAVILLDVVLGYGAHADPAAALVPALREARATGGKPGAPAIVAFVCGTDADPQGLARQEAALREAGAILAENNAQAARVAAALLAR